jgi:uncharacterized protein YlxW (UPF0749 family)
MRRPAAQLALFGLTLVLGFLVVVQFRTQAIAGGLADLSETDLTTLIANLNTRNQQVAAEEADLRARREELRATGSEHSRLIVSLREELSRVRRWAGLEAVQGRGVRVVVDGPVGANALNDLLNEIRATGAEAIAIEDVRITASDVVADLPDGIAVGNRTLSSPVTVWVVGNPQVVTAALTRVGGIIGRIQVSQPEVSVAVVPEASVTLPASGHASGPTASVTLPRRA